MQHSWEPSAVLEACTTTPKRVLNASRRHIPTRVLVSLRWIASNSLPHLHRAQQNTLYKKYQRSNYWCSNSLLFIKHKCPITYTSTLWTAFWCGATPVGLFPTDTHCIPHTVKMSEGREAFASILYTQHPQATLLARALSWLFTRASWSLQELSLWNASRRGGVTLQTADTGLCPTMPPTSLNPHCLNCTASVTTLKPPAVKVSKKKTYSSCVHSPQYLHGEHQLAQLANKVTQLLPIHLCKQGQRILTLTLTTLYTWGVRSRDRALTDIQQTETWRPVLLTSCYRYSCDVLTSQTWFSHPCSSEGATHTTKQHADSPKPTSDTCLKPYCPSVKAVSARSCGLTKAAELYSAAPTTSGHIGWSQRFHSNAIFHHFEQRKLLGREEFSLLRGMTPSQGHMELHTN